MNVKPSFLSVKKTAVCQILFLNKNKNWEKKNRKGKQKYAAIFIVGEDDDFGYILFDLLVHCALFIQNGFYFSFCHRFLPYFV